MQEEQFHQRVLNLYLNADFVPFSYNLFISGSHSYLGYMPNLGLYPKAAVFDFDGVFEFPDSLAAYRLFIVNLFRENTKLKSREDDIKSAIQLIETTGDVRRGEKELEKIYIESNLRKEQCENAKYETVKQFRPARNSGEFVFRVKYELGYLPGIISGSPQMVLEPLGEIIGIDKSNIYGSEFAFDENGRFVGIFLRLNHRKVDAQDIFLQKFANNMYGCRFFFTDEISDAPAAKLGLNPSIFIGEFEREKIPLDVVACCPDARENMLNLITSMYKFEFGYIVANSRTKEEEQKVTELAIDVQEIARETFALKSTDFYIQKKSFIEKAVDLYKASEKYIDKKHEIKQKILRLMINRDEEGEKELMSDIAKFFRKYVAESHAQRGWLEDFV